MRHYQLRLNSDISRQTAIVASAGLFATILALKLAIPTAGFGFAMLYDLPVALLAVAFGVRVGLIGAVIGMALFAIGDAVGTAAFNVAGYASRGGTFLVLAGLLGAYSDRLRRTQTQFRDLLDSGPDPVVVVDVDGDIALVNARAEEVFGYGRAELITRPADVLLPERLRGGHRAYLRRYLADPAPRAMGPGLGLHGRRKDGSEFPVEVSLSPWRSKRRVMVSAAIRDVSERKRFESQLRHVADHDSLTGLFNRRRFGVELDRELARARYESGGAVLAIDLDHFKYVNDVLGHSVGDQLMTRAAAVFGERLRSTDILSRIGGDEFAAILPSISEEDAQLVAESMLAAIHSNCRIESPGGPRRITASIGIATFGAQEGATGEELLVAADIAMYDAKEAGRNRAVLYGADPGRNDRMQARLTWAARIQRALEEDRFVLHVQPIRSLKGDAIPRYEMLLRMVGEDLELIPPTAFLGVAEQMNLIGDIDRWVVRAASRVLAAEQRAGRDVRLELNLSATSIGEPGLAAAIAQALNDAGADPRGLCFEITETAAIVNVALAKRFADELAELGCEFALDDFGSGFASFYYIKHLPFDFLKIDGEFVARLADSKTDQLVVQSLVGIARGLGKQTIAEFVGDQQTLDLLSAYGVDYAQGFFVATPGPLADSGLEPDPDLRGEQVAFATPLC